MSHLINQHPAESLRNAMIAYYLHHKVPEKNKNKINNADDLYEYWLLDVQVSQAVSTSPVACAISSLQQYITRIQLGLEPGYENKGMSTQQKQLWRELLHTYPTWSAGQQLRYHPANYLDPTLRSNKSASFQQLENDLSQYRIQTDAVMTAVQNYLARFEEIANIRTLNGYIDGNTDALHNSSYYFVGKSSSENTYYWRSLNLCKRLGKTLFPYAWSDWKKINLTLAEDTIESSIRPVFFNNRLFFIWAECSRPAPTSAFKTTEEKAENKQRLNEWADNHYPLFRLNFSYKKQGDNWSASQTCIEEYCATEEVNASAIDDIKTITHTVAIVDAGSPDIPPALFLGLHTTDPKEQESFSGRFFQAVQIDEYFNITKVADGGSPSRYKIPPGSKQSEEIRRLLEGFDPSQQQRVKDVVTGQATDNKEYYNELLLGNSRQHFTLFGHKNYANLQFKVSPSTSLSLTVTDQTLTTGKDDWDYEKKQNSIKDIEKDASMFDPNTNELIFTSALNNAFRTPYTITIVKEAYTLTLTTETLGDPQTTQLELSERSQIAWPADGLTTNFYAFYFKNLNTQEQFPNSIHDKKSHLITPPETTLNSTSLSLKGKFIDRNAFVHLYKNTASKFRISLTRYSSYVLAGDSKTNLHGQNATLLINARASVTKFRAYKHVIMLSNFSDYPTPGSIEDNSVRILNFQNIAHNSIIGSSPELPATHKATARIPVTREKLRSGITLIHGVVTLELNDTEPKVLGYALKASTLKSDEDASKSPQPAPTIKTQTSVSLGTAEFIDFSNNVAVQNNDIPATLRMNTCFAGKLVKAANISLEHFFSLTPQTWQEPPLTDAEQAEAIDFQGANGKYFWELFLYLPWLVAHRLNQEQRYEEAQAWLSYIFDPGSAPATSGGRPDHWGFNELNRKHSVPVGITLDPHQLAIGNPVHFRKALYLFYLDILLNRGDADYRQLTPDSLTNAKLWYTRVNQLLGARPAVTTTEPWASITLETLATAPSHVLNQLEKSSPLIDINCPVNDAVLPLLTDTDNLCLPFNPDLVARWDKLESRLHNLRHNLDITGKPLRLALFATPLSPHTLLASQAGRAFDPATAMPFPIEQVGHYRFQVVQGFALTATEAVIQFGNTLLTLIERKEQAEYLELQQQQAWDLANIVVAQHTQALVIDEKNRQALNISRNIHEARLNHYETLLAEGVSHKESQASLLYLLSTGFDVAGSVAGAGAGIAMLAPNIFGTSVGGSRWEGPFYAAQALAQGASAALRGTAADLDRTEQFNRRAQEWVNAQAQARFELDQVDAQLQAYAEQEKATRLQLRLAQTSLAHAWSSYQLLTKRFSKAQLYDWLNAQLSQFYYQAYDLCLSLCLAAEASWQYEIADYNRTFIQPGAWNNSYRGYLAGETLKLALLTMNTAYLQNNVRDLEIVKTISLRHRLLTCEVKPLASETSDADKNTSPVTQAPWTNLKKQLVSKGELCFKLTNDLFEEDYPGHTLRRIKGISVSLPATLGPYEDIKATLTQTSNEIRLSATQSFKDKRAHQQIALSTGLDDNGLFTLTFDSNDRYLPFEYTGAISEWTLSFPNPAMQEALLKSINDIVIHLRYTARATPQQGGRA